MPEPNNGWPRKLDVEGCLFGQHLSKKVNTMNRKLDDLHKTLQRLVISFATASILLALNLIWGFLTQKGAVP